VNAIIVAGGRGLRMGGLGERVPKPMLPIDGRPLLARQLDLLAGQGFEHVTICAGHRAEALGRSLEPLVPGGLTLRMAVDPEPRGSGGCLHNAAPHRAGPTLVIFGDVLLDMELEPLLRFHQHHAAAATAVVHPNRHPHDSDLVEQDPDGRILAIHRKPHPPGLLVRNMAVAGAFVLAQQALQAVPAAGPLDLVHDLLAGMVARGERVFGYRSTEYLKDMGTPRRYRQVQADWAAGRVHAMRRSNPRPAAFLDRDGTINRHVGHLARHQDMELLPGVGPAIRILNERGILAVVTTNQPVLARGEADPDQLDAIHARMELLLGREGAFLDGVYHCPHHPDTGFTGEVVALKGPCACRKPLAGLIHQATAQLPIDLTRSAVFGDSFRDLGMARAAGLPCCLVSPGTGVPAADPVRRFRDLEHAVGWWILDPGGRST